MDFCFNCGSKTDPDWIFCRSCGNGLDESDGEIEEAAASIPSGSPKVELISRGWDVVDVEAVVFPADPLEDEAPAFPLPAGGIEVTVDSITVVHEGEDAAGPNVSAQPVSTDPWDHLRPHGELPPLRDQTTTPARTSQIAVLVVAFSALTAACLRFYLNTRIDAFGDGRASAKAVADVRLVADFGLLVMSALALIAAGTLVWWFVAAQATANFHPGPAGLLAIVSAVAGTSMVAVFFYIEQETVAEALAANSLIVLGLGLLIAACLAAVRTVGRLDLKEPA